MPALRLLSLSCSLVVTLIAASSHAAPSDSNCVAVVSTNDLHGVIESLKTEGPGTALRYGGLLTISSYIKTLRDSYGDRLLLLDAGDIYQGTLPSNLSEGRAMIDLMNAIGYDAATVGNHEFDFGAGEAITQKLGNQLPPPKDRLKVLQDRIAQARFPFLAINIYDKASKKRADWKNLFSSRMFTKGGIKIGVIGAATPDTPRVTRPHNVVTLDFKDPAPLIQKEAQSLRKQGAKLVALVAHMGGKCPDLSNPSDPSTCENDVELLGLLRGLPAGTIDVAVGGHTHQYMRHWVNGTATIEASARGRALGYVEACVAPKGGIDLAQSTIHPPITPCLDAWADNTCKTSRVNESVQAATFEGQAVVVPAAIEAIAKPYLDQAIATASRPLGITLTKPLLRETSVPEQSFGWAVCESMRVASKSVVAVQNLGGVRTDLPAVPLTFAHVFEALPFDNRLAVLDLTGQELQDFIRHLQSRRQGLLPYICGAQVTADGTVQTIGGAAVEPGKTYPIATNDFLALGGEDLNLIFGKLPPERLRVYEIDLREMLIRYLKYTSPSAP